MEAASMVAALPVLVLTAGVTVAPPAAADRAEEVEHAVAVARTAAPCSPLQYSPAVEHAAEIVNQSTLSYLNQTAENIPLDDQHPTALIKDLGVNTTNVMSLQGAGPNEADAIKGVLLEGYKAISDCSYTQVASSRLYAQQSGQVLIVVILAGS